ncbi:MAG: transposase [Candidatus Bathyarchaeota archaeon]
MGRGKKGFILGYQSLFLTEIEGLPLDHEEGPANVNEKQLVEPLLDRILGESIEVELAVADSQLESQSIFDALEARKIRHIIAWRRLKGRENPSDVLTVKDRIDVEGPEWLRVIYKRLRALSESVNGRVKKRIAYSQFTWQGLENASIHVCLVFSVIYAVHSCLWHWAAWAEAECSLLRVRMAQRWLGYIDGTMSLVTTTGPIAALLFFHRVLLTRILAGSCRAVLRLLCLITLSDHLHRIIESARARTLYLPQALSLNFLILL